MSFLTWSQFTLGAKQYVTDEPNPKANAPDIENPLTRRGRKTLLPTLKINLRADCVPARRVERT